MRSWKCQYVRSLAGTGYGTGPFRCCRKARCLRSRLDASVSGAPYADSLLHSAIAPSRQLLAVAADEIQRRERFVLLAEQRLAHDLVLHEVNRAREADRKHVVIVTGGPTVLVRLNAVLMPLTVAVIR